MNIFEFQKIVEKVVKNLPHEFANAIENVDISSEFYPEDYQLTKMHMEHKNGMYLLGLYEGTPLTKRANYTDAIPDKITIFMLPLIRISKDLIQLEKNIESTVIHEVGHHFGLTEKEIREAEKKRRENNLVK